MNTRLTIMAILLGVLCAGCGGMSIQAPGFSLTTGEFDGVKAVIDTRRGAPDPPAEPAPVP